MTSDESYKVGYKRPPLETRFKKGKSGNPRGRPRKDLSLDALLRKELLSTVTVVQGNKEYVLTVAEAFAKSILKDATRRDRHARSIVVEAMKNLDTSRAAEDPANNTVIILPRNGFETCVDGQSPKKKD